MASRGFLGLMGCFVVMVVILTEGAAAVTHTVGDTTGWTIPPNSSFYENWADDKTFSVGDELSFTWAGTHDVAKVSESQYDQCTKVPAINGNSPLLVPLNATGDHYFICTIATHCASGQKLKVEVSNSTTTPTPGSPPSTTTPPSSTNTSSPSSSPSFAPIATLSAAISVLVFSFLA